MAGRALAAGVDLLVDLAVLAFGIVMEKREVFDLCANRKIGDGEAIGMAPSFFGMVVFFAVLRVCDQEVGSTNGFNESFRHGAQGSAVVEVGKSVAGLDFQLVIGGIDNFVAVLFEEISDAAARMIERKAADEH